MEIVTHTQKLIQIVLTSGEAELLRDLIQNYPGDEESIDMYHLRKELFDALKNLDL